jgi:hypothetical protein
MYVYVATLEAAAPTVFMCWLWARHLNCSALNNKDNIKVFVITLEAVKIHTKEQRYKIRRMYI